MSQTPISVAIVDDESLVRDGYRSLFGGQTEFELVGEASDGKAGVALYRKERPDVMLMDLKMPIMSGVNAIETIIEEYPHACIVALTTFDSREAVLSALSAGAQGYLVKGLPSAEFLEGLRTAVAREMPLSASARVAVAAASRVCVTPVSRTAKSLTSRGKELLRCLDYGMSNKEIAAQLYLGESTVRQYLHHLAIELGESRRTKMVAKARELGLVPPRVFLQVDGAEELLVAD